MPEDKLFRILVICTGNRARSQMALGWLRHLGGSRVEVESAGIQPKGVHPLAVRVMAESGIDISRHTSDHVDHYTAQDFDLVITVCDSVHESCPVPAQSGCSTTYKDPDRPGMDEAALVNVFRHVRDEIGVFVRELVETELCP